MERMNNRLFRCWKTIATPQNGILALGIVLILFATCGCNTVKGIAKDVYSITEGVQNEMSNDNSSADIQHNEWD